MFAYAQNPHHPALPGQLREWINAPGPQPGMAKWLLLDGAMLDREMIISQLPPELATIDLHNVFARSRFAVYADLAPFLIRCDELDGATRVAGLEALLAFSQCHPMLSALSATADTDALCECLCWLADTETEDGMPMYCRFADTRISPALLAVLEPHQIDKVLHSIGEWLVINRFGGLQNITPTAQSATPPDFISSAPLVLTDAQFASLLATSQTDEIFAVLAEGFPELVPADARGHFHYWLAAILANAQGRGLRSNAELVQFAVLALTTQARFDAHPILKKTWALVATRQATFPQLVEIWSDKIWAALEQPLQATSVGSAA